MDFNEPIDQRGAFYLINTPLLVHIETVWLSKVLSVFHVVFDLLAKLTHVVYVIYGLPVNWIEL